MIYTSCNKAPILDFKNGNAFNNVEKYVSKRTCDILESTLTNYLIYKM